MIISELHIHNLRYISSARLHFNPGFNFVSGINGSGKTSLLEAFYLLGSGHSFRSRDLSSIISYGADNLTVFGRSLENDMISVQKSLSKPTLVKINNQFCPSSSKLAYSLPIQVFYQDLFQIMDAGPAVRRSLLDWGLFHVKHDYLHLLNQYKRLIKQRNALLKQRADSQQFMIWDQQISDLGEQLDQQRNAYFLQWQEEFHAILNQLSSINCKISYFKGWDKKGLGSSLFEVLQKNLPNDQLRLYTQQGCHQADLIIEASDNKAKNVLSRGQQKIILIALKLSQAIMLDKPCLYLFDDLAAELDNHHQHKLMDYLSSQKHQMVFTSTEPLSTINDKIAGQASYFKVTEGEFSVIDTSNVSRETQA